MASPPPPKTVGTTAAPPLLHHLIALDTTVSHHLHSLSQPFLPRVLLMVLELSADFRFFFPVSLSLLMYFPLLYPIFLPLLLGSLLDLALIGLLKLLIRRSRPLYNKNMNVAVSVDHFSFPSGHASRVCFVAAVVCLSAVAIRNAVTELRSGGGGAFLERWIGGDDGKVVNFVVSIVWTWAVATSVSRVLLGRHFVLDVFAGACLGVLEGLIAFNFLRF